MAKRLASMMILMASSIGVMTGCDNSADPVNTATSEVAQITKSLESTSTSSTTDIDWTAVATDEPAAMRADYKYPFTIDSQNVQDYADYFKVDNATAQHNLTVGMASNEALSKVLDQLEGTYISHQLTDGEKVELIIHTTPEVKASRYDYVFEEDFAKGLVLPIVIQPDGVKGDAKAHGEMVE